MVNQLNRVKVTMGQVPHSEGFQGAAQRSMGIYVRQVHDNAAETLAGNVTDLSREFEQLITMFRSGVDSRDDAILDTDYLQEQRQKLESLYRELDQGIHKGNEGCTQASGLATVIRLRTTALTELEDSERSIMQTQQRLAEFNGIRTPQRISNLSDSAAKVASHIKVSLDHKGDNVFMGGLGQTTKAKVKHGKKNQRVTVRSVNHRAVHHEDKNESFINLSVSSVLALLEHNGVHDNMTIGIGFAIDILLRTNGGKHSPSWSEAGGALRDTVFDLAAGNVLQKGVAALGIATNSLPGLFLITMLGTGLSVEASYIIENPKEVKKSMEKTTKEAKKVDYKKLGAFESGHLKSATPKKRSVAGTYAAAYSGHYQK
ncbi:hypothetical protein ACRYI5_09290 [Furfurilactobacillus sp. WILCCON 0119]